MTTVTPAASSSTGQPGSGAGNAGMPLWHWHGGGEQEIEKIAIRNLNFFYGTVQVLKGINLSLNDRRVTAIIGPSGCGKSTLSRVLNRIFDLYPDHRATGEVLIDGENILSPATDVRRLRARIGMTFQKPNPLPLSIFENVAFGIRLHHRFVQV